MIVENIQNAGLYAGLGKRFADAFEYLKSAELDKLAPGRYAISGDDIYVSVSEYETIDPAQGKAEAHKKYADIQFVVSGEEKIGLAPLHRCEPVSEYDGGKDIQFFRGDLEFMTLRAGDFALLLPDDVHMPKCKCGASGPVKKAIVKVRLD